LTVTLANAAFDEAARAAAAEAFAAEHERTYGHRASDDEPVELVSLAVLGRGKKRSRDARFLPANTPGPRNRATRQAYFGDAGWRDTDLIARAELSAHPRNGPLIIEEYDATIIIPPDATASRDAAGNVVIELIYAA
jgi:N-methylhydantoinase A